MTEVPEHLLRRSRERRAALGLGGDAPEASADAPAAAAESAAEPAAASPAPATEAAVPAAAAAPAVVEAPPYVRPAPPRRVPGWMYPVLVGLPLWAVLYFGAFGTRGEAGPVDPLVLGERVYQVAGCAGCHGASGQGVGTFPALSGGESVRTFPDEADHVSWVRTGSAPFKGQPYGDPDREGGPRIAETGSMPAFGGTLTDEEIDAVVQYEREAL